MVEFLEHWKPYVTVAWSILVSVLTVLLWPLLYRWYRLHKQYVRMARHSIDEYAEIILFGVFKNQIQYDGIGGVPVKYFGEHLHALITKWNAKSSPDIVRPADPVHAKHLRTIMRINAGPCLLHSRLDCYFNVAVLHGGDEYRFARFVACMVRPDLGKLTWHDCPRIVLIEEGALAKVLSEDILPPTDSEDGRLWLRLLREIADLHQRGDSAIEIFTAPR